MRRLRKQTLSTAVEYVLQAPRRLREFEAGQLEEMDGVLVNFTRPEMTLPPVDLISIIDKFRQRAFARSAECPKVSLTYTNLKYDGIQIKPWVQYMVTCLGDGVLINGTIYNHNNYFVMVGDVVCTLTLYLTVNMDTGETARDIKITSEDPSFIFDPKKLTGDAQLSASRTNSITRSRQ